MVVKFSKNAKSREKVILNIKSILSLNGCLLNSQVFTAPVQTWWMAFKLNLETKQCDNSWSSYLKERLVGVNMWLVFFVVTLFDISWAED